MDPGLPGPGSDLNPAADGNLHPTFSTRPTTDHVQVTTKGAVTCLHGPSPLPTSVAGVCNGGMGSLGTARFLNSVTRPIPVIDFKDAIEAICKPQFPHASYVKERNAGK